jgi:uncharacterized protein (TIRG00374 family)
MIPRKKKSIVALIASIFILAVILSRMNLGKTWAAITGVSWAWVATVLLLNLINTWIEAVRWKLIISSVKKEARVSSAFAGILAGVVGNAILPFRLGDGLRAYYLAKEEDIPVASSLSTVVLDRIADVTFFLALVAVTAVFFHLSLIFTRKNLYEALSLTGILILVIVLLRFAAKSSFKSAGRIGRRISEQLARFTKGLSSLRGTDLHLPIGFLSALSWIVRLTMVYVMFLAFHLSLPVIAAPVVLIFINLGIAIVSTPANLGGFELAALAAFRFFPVDGETAISYALVFHAAEVLPMVLLGLIVMFFVARGRARGKLESMIPSEEIPIPYERAAGLESLENLEEVGAAFSPVWGKDKREG